MGPGMQSLLAVHDWEMAQALWPALVTCASSEKDSIVVLSEKLMKGTDLYEAAPLELKVGKVEGWRGFILASCHFALQQIWMMRTSFILLHVLFNIEAYSLTLHFVWLDLKLNGHTSFYV